MGMGIVKARHLMGRTGFGASPAQLDKMASRSVGDGVERLLKGLRRGAATPAPKWVSQPFPGVAERQMMSRKDRRQVSRERAAELRSWWYAEMVATPSPLTEQLVLLWHNHFTSSVRKVKWIPFIYKQNETLRRHAGGRFSDLLMAMTKDPAMLIYLDNQSSHKTEPNENFARELLELFVLGEGNYTERDIKEAARAFTGWRMRRRTGKFRFVKADHDKGQKVFLGKKGAWKGDDIVRILLENPRTSEHITEKFWRVFVSETPDRAHVERLAKRFRSSGYQSKVLLREILTSEPFWAASSRGVLTKSPVDLIVGSLRTFEVEAKDGTVLGQVGQRLGQDLLSPPNVKGWPGGRRWISTQTLLARHEIMLRFVDRALKGGRLEVRDWLGLSGARAMEKAQKVLLPFEPVRSVGARLNNDALSQMVLDPAYQLK